jgi:hypothetical protein
MWIIIAAFCKSRYLTKMQAAKIAKKNKKDSILE